MRRGGLCCRRGICARITERIGGGGGLLAWSSWSLHCARKVDRKEERKTSAPINILLRANSLSDPSSPPQRPHVLPTANCTSTPLTPSSPFSLSTSLTTSSTLAVAGSWDMRVFDTGFEAGALFHADVY